MSHFIDEDIAHTTNGKTKLLDFQPEVLFNYSTCALLRRLGRIWESEGEDIGIGAIGLGEVRDRGPVKSRCLSGFLNMAVQPPCGACGLQDTSVLFLAPFARAQEIGRDPREEPLLSVGIC